MQGRERQWGLAWRRGVPLASSDMGLRGAGRALGVPSPGRKTRCGWIAAPIPRASPS